VNGDVLGRFRRWFWQPPRAHGEIITDRTVSFLELFYDLVYVVVIGQAAHHLAEHVSAQGFVEFAAVFGLIWWAWANGSLWVELHGREDGRTRSFIFLQMGILAVLATFTADATASQGRPFALTYVAFVLVLTWLWYSVRRLDRPEFRAETGAYLAGMLASLVVITVSAFLADGPRLVAWLAFTVAWSIGITQIRRRYPAVDEATMLVTESMVERFGLFVIIVLGEVVVGVVGGLSAADADPLIIVTGMVALSVGFGLWWIYFDFVGRRRPRPGAQARYLWMLSHLPVTLAIAAGGAGMVSLIEHAAMAHTPAATAWLLSGSVAGTLLAVILISRSLADRDLLPSVYRTVARALSAGAFVALVVGWWAPAPWLLALALVGVLLVVWLVALKSYLVATQNTETAADA
jgi:low temperature requirement protein LtrA